MHVNLKVATPRAEQEIVEIARVSSSRKDKTEAPENLIGYLIKNKHWSPFEHASMTLEIVTSKAIGIQLLRHRSFTFQEFSQRYAKVTEMEPIELREQHASNRQSSTSVFNPLIRIKNPVESFEMEAQNAIYLFIEQAQNLYDSLLESGVAKECARMILPMATQTKIYMTGNIRSWIHMLQIRDDSHAQKEAQEIAKACKVIFNDQFPLISKALGWDEQLALTDPLDKINDNGRQKTVKTQLTPVIINNIQWRVLT